MLPTDANLIGKLNVQPWSATKTPDAALKSPERLIRPEAGFIPAKPEAPRQALQNTQSNPFTLLNNALNVSSLVTYTWGNKLNSQAFNPSKTSTTSYEEEASWDEEYDPLTGEFKIKSVDRRIPVLKDESDNPFHRTLNVVS